jgi:uncharacterized membrane protein YfcA
MLLYEFLVFILLRFLAGLAAGLLQDFLGIGGSIIQTPTLFFIFIHINIDPYVYMQMAIVHLLLAWYEQLLLFDCRL